MTYRALERKPRSNETPEARDERIKRLVAAGAEGRANARANAAAHASKSRTHLRASDLDALHMEPAFPNLDWMVYYKGLRNDLRRKYAPVLAEAPQYVILCDRLAFLVTAAHIHDANRKPIEERLDLEDRIRFLVAQIQRYTEAEKRIEVQLTQTKVEQFEGFCAIVDHLVTDGELKVQLFQAFRRFGRGNDAATVLAALSAQATALLPMPNGVVEHVPGEAPRG